MSEIPTGLGYWPYPTRSVICPSASLHRSQTWAAPGGSSAELRATQWWRASMTNQHPTLNSSMRPHSTQALGHHHMHVQSGVHQTAAFQGTRGSSGAQIPFNPHHGAHPGPQVVNVGLIHIQSGGPRPLQPAGNYDTPIANNPNVPRQSFAGSNTAQSFPAQNFHQGHRVTTDGQWYTHMAQPLGACALQSSLQVAVPSQQLPPEDLSNLLAVTAQPSQPPSVPPESFEDSSFTNPSSVSVREEEEPKEIVSATEPCPFPGCKKEYNRPQELERHICEHHLPPQLYCEQPGCDLIGKRVYLLKDHRTDKHPGMPEQDTFLIYDAKVIAKQVRTGEIGIEEAVHKACMMFDEKAKQEGKLWRWTNGL